MCLLLDQSLVGIELLQVSDVCATRFLLCLEHGSLLEVELLDLGDTLIGTRLLEIIMPLLLLEVLLLVLDRGSNLRTILIIVICRAENHPDC